MIKRTILLLLMSLSICGSAPRQPQTPLEPGLIQVPKNINHDPFDALLKKYVDKSGLVNYGEWKKSTADMASLKSYLQTYAPTNKAMASGIDRMASLINCYNALTLNWILQNYPTPSIRELEGSFTTRRHAVGGRIVSLDEIEHKTLRLMGDPRIHSALVCAARSCPPLRTEAFRPETLSKQLDDSMTAWLARPDLNTFNLKSRTAHISSIFKWFGEDFESAGGVKDVLKKYAPLSAQPLFTGGSFYINYLDYNWGLNDQGGQGKDYKHGLLKKVFGSR